MTLGTLPARMQIKITPLNPALEQPGGLCILPGYYYQGRATASGTVTRVDEGDQWLEAETAWLSRSEIPFITALRHVQLESPHLVLGLTPAVHRFELSYCVEAVEDFPTATECASLLDRECASLLAGGAYQVEPRPEINEFAVGTHTQAFDKSNSLLLRAGSCLHKAYVLLNTSHVFAEEVYVNAFIAFEAIVGNLMVAKGLGRRKDAIHLIADFMRPLEPGMDFLEHEEEMRDWIRNDIIHPLRSHGTINENPSTYMGFIYEDLGLIDWLFKQSIAGNLDPG